MSAQRNILEPLDVIDQHVVALRDIAARLLADNERLRRREIELMREVSMAHDAINAFRAQLDQKRRENDELRATIDSLVPRRGTR